MKIGHLQHLFVEEIPANLEDGKIYVSITYAIAVHRCCCGCGSEVVTPFSPMDWTLIFDGNSVSLHPSIGNWSFGCQSHYWIGKSQVIQAPRWTSEKIDAARSREALARSTFFDSSQPEQLTNSRPSSVLKQPGRVVIASWGKLTGWVSRLRNRSW